MSWLLRFRFLPADCVIIEAVRVSHYNCRVIFFYMLFERKQL